MKAKMRMRTSSSDDAELLAGDGEDEVGVGVGQDALQRALARPLAEPAARHEAVHRGIDLERIAWVRRRPVDARVRGTCRCARARAAGTCRRTTAPVTPMPPMPATQSQCRPAMKNSAAPDERDQHGLAEIGLQHQRHDGGRQQQQGEGVPGTSRRRAPSENAQAARMTKAGLHELRRLDAEDPAPRALDLDAEQQGREERAHADDVDA